MFIVKLSQEQASYLKVLLEQSKNSGDGVTLFLDWGGLEVAWGGILRSHAFGTTLNGPAGVLAKSNSHSNATKEYTDALENKPSGNPYANVSADNPIVVELKKLTEAVNRINPRRMSIDKFDFS